MSKLSSSFSHLANPSAAATQAVSDNASSSGSSSSDGSAQLQLNIEGMTCQTCANRIEKVLNKKNAISKVSVNYAGEMATVVYDSEQVDAEQIIKWVNKAGFQATEFVAEKQFEPVDTEAKTGLKLSIDDWRMLALAVCLLPFVVGMLGMMLGYGMGWMLPIGLQFLLATFVQFVLATPFYRSAWESLKGGMANMDVLVVLGTLTIWSYSSFVWLVSLVAEVSTLSGRIGEHVYFEAGVMIIAFVRLGKYLEARTKKQSLNSIDMMLSLTPEVVERQSDIGDFHEIDLKDVVVADVLRAKQGSRIATDGLVIDGEGWCDESHLTGESELLLKETGDMVLAGAMVDNGSLTYRVYAKGSDTKLGDMIKALNDAQGSKAPIARLADKVANVFVPFVIVVAVLTAILTYYFTQSIETSILHAVSVLVVACPCALGLATPAAIMAGMGVAARHGVMFKDASSLESAGNIDTVVLDKTGTLTQGKPSLVAHLLMDKSLQYREVLQLTASVEAHASHPFASTLVASAKKDGIKLLPVKEVTVIAGQGIQATIYPLGVVKVGRPDWLQMTIPEKIAKRMPKVLKVSSLVAVSANDIPLAIFAMADDIREDAKRTIDSLQQAGLDVVLMSGDKREVVTHVSDALGIEHAHAQMTPRSKSLEIRQLQAKGHRVAMVGDGVNDAPAMVQADASFAMYEGTDIAHHSASARLMAGSLYQVYEARQIANATVTHIKQNLFLAFVYNCLAIPLAAFGFLNPVIAAALMAMSSISVLLNALRLTKYKVKQIEQLESSVTQQ